MTTPAHDADEAATSGEGWSGLFARVWSDDTPEPIPDHPAPEVPAHPVERDGLSRGPKVLLGKLAPGWTWVASRSRGSKPLTRKPWIGAVVDVARLDLRHRTSNLAAVALWVDGKFDEAYTWSLCVDPSCAHAALPHPADVPRRIGSRDLAALVAT